LADAILVEADRTRDAFHARGTRLADFFGAASHHIAVPIAANQVTFAVRIGAAAVADAAEHVLAAGPTDTGLRIVVGALLGRDEATRHGKGQS
jgi:hypothetical protein